MSHVFRHPKYYKELRKIRARPAPDPIVVTEEDLKAVEEFDKQQAASAEPQAKDSSRKRQASSDEQQASSDKPEAASS